MTHDAQLEGGPIISLFPLKHTMQSGRGTLRACFPRAGPNCDSKYHIRVTNVKKEGKYHEDGTDVRRRLLGNEDNPPTGLAATQLAQNLVHLGKGTGSRLAAQLPSRGKR